ncbi:MAG: histidinol-phosphate transaminase [Gammaproteobacteria bacterium]|nr:histidinol-phosphate transaminase [Gammaproteobacteria bacterium]
MSAPVNPQIAGLTPYQPGKPIEELTRELGITDIIKLASNENPRGPGALVTEALSEAGSSLSRYPDGSGYSLKRALARHLHVDESQLTLGNGSNDVLEQAAKIALSPGAEAIVAAHSFVVYRLAVTSCNATLVTTPAKNYGADLGAFLDAVTGRTAIVFLANPNNPTGTWVIENEFVDFLEAIGPDVWVVLDEAYWEYVDEPGYPDGTKLLQRYPNLIVTRTFSKIHGLAALRMGYGISSPLAADLMNRVRQPFNVNSLALAAAEAALQDQEFTATSRQMNKTGKQTLRDGLDNLGFPYIPSAANFLCVDVGMESMPVYQALLKEGVIVRPVAEYGLPNHLRVTVGLPGENERFLHTLSRVIEKLRG